MTVERSISVRDNEVLDQVLLSMLTSPGNCSTCDGGGGSHLASKDLGENVRPFITTPALSFSFFFFFFLEVERSSRTLIPLLMPGSVHNGSAS